METFWIWARPMVVSEHTIVLYCIALHCIVFIFHGLWRPNGNETSCHTHSHTFLSSYHTLNSPLLTQTTQMTANKARRNNKTPETHPYATCASTTKTPTKTPSYHPANAAATPASSTSDASANGTPQKPTTKSASYPPSMPPAPSAKPHSSPISS